MLKRYLNKKSMECLNLSPNLYSHPHFQNIQTHEDQMSIRMLQKIYTEITCREGL